MPVGPQGGLDARILVPPSPVDPRAFDTLLGGDSATLAASSAKAGGRHDGHDVVRSAAEQRREARERQLAVAATWHLDPALLKPLPTDSDKTVRARHTLARVNDHLTDVMATYDAAQARAVDAQDAADTAADDLEVAQTLEAAARARYEQQHDTLVSIVVGAYEGGTLAPMQAAMSAKSGPEFLSGVSLIRQMSDSQAASVRAADVAAEDLEDAASVTDAAAQVADDRLTDARDRLSEATRARDEVLDDVNRARLLLEDRVLADQIETALMFGQAAAAAAAQYVATGAKVAFPLPPGTAFTDQHNYGHRGSRWASIHTGDDFSTACGTPVLAATGGTVLIRTDQSWSGRWLVMISTGPGQMTTWYAHMEALTVTDGQQVKAGQAIGLVGQEGNASGCHLHFEVHPAGGSIYQDNTDPGAWLRAAGVYPGA